MSTSFSNILKQAWPQLFYIEFESIGSLPLNLLHADEGQQITRDAQWGLEFIWHTSNRSRNFDLNFSNDQVHKV